MEVNLFLHGVPNGKSYSGLEEDRAFFTTFYKTDINDDLTLLVQPRKVNSRIYFYYHILQYKNVKDVEGRGGAYFGLSLRLDQFCHNVSKIYNLLNIIYEKIILGGVLKNEGNGYLRYLISSFSPELARNIESALVNLIGQSLTSSDFSSSSFTGNGTASVYLGDASNDYIISLTHSCSSIAVASWFPSRIEQSLRQNFDANVEAKVASYKYDLVSKAQIIKSLENQISGLNLDIVELKSRIESLYNDVSQLTPFKAEAGQLNVKIKAISQEKDSLQAEVAKLLQEKQSYVSALDKYKNSAAVIEDLKRKANSLNDRLQSAYKENDALKRRARNPEPDYVHQPKERKSPIKWIKGNMLFVCASLVAFLILLCLAFFVGHKNTRRYKADNIILNERVDSMQNALAVSASKIEDLNQTIAFFDVEPEDPLSPDAKIEVLEYNGQGPLQLGMKYTVKLMNANTSTVRWECAGVSIKNPSDSKTTIIPSNSGHITIYCRNEEGKLITSRSFDVDGFENE